MKPSAPNISGMSRLIEYLIEYRRLLFSLVALLVAVGLMAFSSMARQEDPSFPYRAGLIKVFYPGGTPAQIEKLITDPLEQELAQISEIDTLNSVSRDDIAIFSIDLLDAVYDTDAAWDRVQRAIARARLVFPAGVAKIEFDDRQIDMPVAVISITGSNDALILDNAATRLKKQLLSISGVSRIEVEGAPERELIVKLDQQTINRLGISRQFIASTLMQRNQIIPGGVISKSDKNIRLNTQSDFATIAELESTILSLPNGQLVPLNAIAEISLEPKLPLAAQVFKDGRRAVSLGIIADRGQVDAVKLGQQIRSRLSEIQDQFAPLKLEESFFQPDYVTNRLSGLQSNLMISVLIIALVVFLAMGWRTGILVALVLPVVSIVSLGLYNVGGGVFHQMAVIGIVISLGILIDNAIVVIEYIETAIRNGVSRAEAIRNAIRLLAKPLMTSTGTTVAAFIPLLLAEGGVGDFTRAIPTMITIALIVSYLISVFTLPLIAFYWLKPKPLGHADPLAIKLTKALATKCADLVEYKTSWVLLGTFLMVSVSVLMASSLKREFFPSTDRAQIVVDIEMPNNTPLAVTQRTSREIEQQLLEHEFVVAVYRAVGGAGFRFYYNLGGGSNESHSARLTINTGDQKYNLPLVNWIRENIKPKYPDVLLVPRLLGQGPPRVAPIEIRVKHSDAQTLFSASQTVKRLLSRIDGVSELRSDLDLGTPELVIDIQESAALTLGLQPNEVARAVFAESRGLSAGQFLYADDPIPIRVRSSKGQDTDLDTVRNQYIYGQGQQAAPISQLAAMSASWTPTVIRHHNSVRTVKVLAQVKKGYAFNQILSEFKLLLEDESIANDVVIEYGGDAAASSEANSNIATSAPLAVGLLIFFMMLQFNSFRRIGIVFATIPLAAVGVIPGLVLSGQPFGFQSLLGVIALVGIVVNNAIVLIDVIDQALANDADIKSAVRQALEQRTAPIILTTSTTILGLLPLALSSSTLWPPMAWAIISGLTLSTVLTLVAIPALCVLTLGRKQQWVAPIQTGPISIVVVWLAASALLFVPNQKAMAEVALEYPGKQVLTIENVIELVDSNRRISASRDELSAAEFEEARTKRQAWAPKVSVGGEYSRREDAAIISLPMSDLTVSDASSYIYEVKLTQPIFQPALQRYQAAIAKFQTDISVAKSDFVTHQTTGQAIDQYLTILSLQESRTAQIALRDSLSVRRDRIQRELNLGRVLKTDLLQIEVELNNIIQRLVELDNRVAVETSQLARSLNKPIDTPFLFTAIGDQYAYLTSKALPKLGPLSCLARGDCLALEAQLQVLKSQRKQINASALPAVNLSLADRRSDGQLFVAESDRRAVLEFSWALFSGGQRKQQKNIIKANQAALQARLVDTQQLIQIDSMKALALYSNGRSALQLAERTLSLSDERLRLSRKRYDNGLLNLDQLLDAEASLSSSAAQLTIAKIDLLRAWVQSRLATGEGFEALSEKSLSQE